MFLPRKRNAKHAAPSRGTTSVTPDKCWVCDVEVLAGGACDRCIHAGLSQLRDVA